MKIPSCNGTLCLSFHSRGVETFTVSVDKGNPQASVRVCDYTDCDELVGLFASMAEDWSGWEGTRSWVSIEGEFCISASIARTGEVTLRIQLRQHLEEWEVKVPIIVEAGQLEMIARRVADFFS